MTCQELATSVSERLPILVALINNAHLGMVRQWQDLFNEKRRSQVYLGYESPDYVKLAEAYGCVGLRARRAAEVDGVIREGLERRDRTVIIDFQVDELEMCYPMVPAGMTNDDIELGPLFDRPAHARNLGSRGAPVAKT
jgi:acetolactate synthase-1/2/3 large subunit